MFNYVLTFSGVLRIQFLSNDPSIAAMWSNSRFMTVFVLHKVGTLRYKSSHCHTNFLPNTSVAIPFYVLAVRVAVLLCSPVMFHNSPWVRLVQAMMKNNPTSMDDVLY